jgi:hypothetical protein
LSRSEATGGWRDLEGEVDTVEEAKALFEALYHPDHRDHYCADVVDVEARQIVASYREGFNHETGQLEIGWR